MKNLIFLLAILIGLGSNAQTTSHMTIQGRFYATNQPIVNPQNFFDIELYEWDSVTNSSTLLSSTWYTINYNSNSYQVVMNLMYNQNKYLLVRAKPKPGTTYFNSYTSTWSPRSLNVTSAKKIWFSSQNPIPVADFFMVPNFGQLIIYRHTF